MFNVGGYSQELTATAKFAVQFAVVPPFSPAQLQFHGPVPVTALAVPALHKFAIGTVLKLPPLLLPHSPWTGGGALPTVIFCVTAGAGL